MKNNKVRVNLEMRYFPSSFEPPYWQGWPVDMPSSEESSPNADSPLGVQGTSEAASPNSSSGGSSSKISNAKRFDGKKCGVCGDRALGYNFNAVTCESCKAFFRRNALKNKEYRCPFSDSCEVTEVTRRFCQRCRLRKCFQIGMKKEWIMTEEEKKKKRKKIQENRARKIGDLDYSSPGGTLGSPDQDSVYESDPPSVHCRKSCDETEEDEGRSFTNGGNDLTLPSKSLSSSNGSFKPKAVVVGRVRVEEKDSKVRKISADSDVHTSKLVLPLHFKPLTTSSASTLPTDHMDTFANLVGNQDARTNAETHPQQPLDSIVAGLLRTQSQESAEDDTNSMDTSTPWSSPSAEEKKPEVSVIVKAEPEDETAVNEDTKPPLPLYSAPINCSHTPPQPYPQDNIHPDNPYNAPSSQADTQEFNFIIQEALNIIQPGCQERGTTPFSSGKSVMDSIVNAAIRAEYSAFSLLANSHSSELNQAESIKITELLEASRGLNSPLCEEPNYKDLPNPSLINVINLTEIAIRRLIKMAKKISAFKMFCQEDQIALLKGGCTEMMILRSVSAYDPDKDVWKIQEDHERFKDIKLKVLKSAPGKIYEEHKRFMLSFQSEWRQDTRIIALLAAIALFTPERANVLHSEAVRHEQCSYLYLLKRYLECRYGGCIGKTNYMKLLEIIGNLHILNEDHVRVFLEVNPQEVEPLLIEIFDLKQS